MNELAPLFIALLSAAGGIVAGVRLVRYLYVRPIDSLAGKLFDKLMHPLVRVGELQPGEGEVSAFSSPRPRHRF